MKSILRTLALLGGLLAVAVVQAGDLHVSPSGTDAADRGAEVAPLQSLAYACAMATDGDVVRLTAGSFRESAQSVPASGVRIVGAGPEATTVYAPSSWNFTADGFDDDEGGYVILLDGVADVRVEGIRFVGNDHRANGALRCVDATDVDIRHVAVVDFRRTGIVVRGCSGLTLAHAEIFDSGFEAGPDPNSKFTNGASLGNVSVHETIDATFHDVHIETTDLHGYGLKMDKIERCTFYNFTFDMYPYQSWNGHDGPNRGNFDLEIHGSHVKESEFYNSRFGQTVSLVAGSGVKYDDVDYSLHLHHNHFDLQQAYGIELVTDKVVVDHNYFGETWTMGQSFANEYGRIRDVTYAHNVAADANSRLLGMKGKADNVRVFNNTVVYADDAWQHNFITHGSQFDSESWAIANNLVIAGKRSDVPEALVSVYDDPSTAPPRYLDVEHNLLHGIPAAVRVRGEFVEPAAWDHVYTANLDVDPALPLADDGPGEAYYPPAGSPAVDAGDNGYGITTDYVGAARDIGAYERGEAPFEFGPDAEWDTEYLWAPRSSIKEQSYFGEVAVDLHTDASGAEIRYTLDGSEPSITSPLYTEPVVITSDVTLKAKTFRGRWASLTAYVRRFREGIEGCTNVGVGGEYDASSQYDFHYGPEKAFDGAKKTWQGWSAKGKDEAHWMQVDLGEPYRTDHVTLYARSQIGDPADDSNRRNFEIRASNDPAFGDYVVLAAQGSPGLPFEGVFTAEPTERGAYRYVRAAKTVSGEGFFISELELRSCGAERPVATDESIASEGEVVLFPNPASSSVRFGTTRSGAVYDVLGARVLDFEGVDRLEFDLPPASYVVRFRGGGVGRLVVR